MAKQTDTSENKISCSTSVTIPNDLIERMIELVFTIPQEVCGNGTIEKNTLFIDKELNKGVEVIVKGKKRGKCLTKHKLIIFHTHQAVYPDCVKTPPSDYVKPNKPYPSLEDIRKLIKHQKVCHSFIATSWGLWCISNTGKKPSASYDKILEQSQHDYYKLFVPLRCEQFYKPIDKVLETLNNINKKLSSDLGLSIVFYSWDHLTKGNNGIVLLL